MRKVVDAVTGLFATQEQKELNGVLSSIHNSKKQRIKSAKSFHKNRISNDRDMVKSLNRIGQEKRKLELLQEQSQIEAEAQQRVVEATQKNLELKKKEKKQLTANLKDWLND